MWDEWVERRVKFAHTKPNIHCELIIVIRSGSDDVSRIRKIEFVNFESRLLTLFIRVVWNRNTFQYFRSISILMNFHSVREREQRKTMFNVWFFPCFCISTCIGFFSGVVISIFYEEYAVDVENENMIKWLFGLARYLRSNKFQWKSTTYKHLN